jgi:tripartite-type tricarboxylate transporter receptor subunit TctC
MAHLRRTRVVLATTLTAAALLAAATFQATAEDYPNRPVTLVVPFAPGGSTTIVARIIAERMAETLGQQIIIDNRPGAGGTVGTRQVAKSAPDGYTIVLGYTGTLAIGPSLFPNVGYDVRKDFAPIGRIASAPNTLAVHPSFNVHSVPELIAYAKANPGKVNYGSAGVGTVGHVGGELLATRAGIKLTHIPYKGTGPAMTDLLGGHILMSFAPVPAVHESARGGCCASSRSQASRAPRSSRRCRPERPARIRGGAALRPRCARGDAAPDRRPAQQGAQCRARFQGGPRPPRRRGRRAAAQHARGIRRRHRPRGGAMVEGGQGVGREAGMIRATLAAPQCSSR